MKTYANHPFLKDSLDKILGLATLTPYGANVQLAIDEIINDVFEYMATEKPVDPDAFLQAFTNGLIRLANRADETMSSYRKMLYNAALLVEMIHIAPHVKPVQQSQTTSMFQKFQLDASFR